MDSKFSNLPLRKGVGIVLLNNNNQVFVAKRIDNPNDFWQMPQGGIDKDENPLDAAFRELKEETSIKNVELIQEIQNEIKINEGRVSKSLSSKTNYLIAGENMGPKKKIKANDLKIKIISEDDFISMI